jgi:acyl-CoA reductase-like NAD-dependent aldehyde dehydrogenase
MKIINPFDETVIHEIQEDTAQSIAEKFDKVKEGQKAWTSVSLVDRIQCFVRFNELLEENKDKLAADLTNEMGKPLWQSYNEINGAKSRIDFFIKNSEKYLAEEWITEEGATREKIVYEPLGVIGNISAWNYPFLVGVNVFVPALIGGNSVLYKPSEYATLTGLNIQILLYKSGIPENAFEIVLGKAEAGQVLLDLPLNGYFFTGSYKTGKHIATQTSGKLVNVQLELGGKDPLYVMDDIENVQQVAEAALEGAMYNNGQSCCAVERIYVQENIYDTFVQEFTAAAKKMKVGNPQTEGTEIGPLSRKEQIDFLSSQVKDAEEKGGKIVSGGKPIDGTGYFFEPTVITEANHSMKIMKEESFGPVIGIQKVSSDEEALKLMQDTDYGLTASVYSKSYERGEKLFTNLDTGTVYWNCCDRVSAGLPWSGRKQSGLGATLSHLGIRAFVQPKAYHIRG